MPDLLQTSISGLLAFQRALATTSHNISNVNTEGYSRQNTEFAARAPQFFGGGYIGSGVETSAIRRVFDESLQLTVRTNTSELGRLESFSELTGRIDSLLADKSAGLAPSLQAFFNAAQGVANDPSSETSREVMLAEGQNLANRFGFLDQRFNELEADVNSRMQVQVDEINQYADSIARINEEIVVALGRSQGAPPNDLLDTRDQLITELSQRISTQVVMQDNGAANVFIGNGQGLVVNTTASELGIVQGSYELNRPEIAFVSGTGSVNVTRSLSGGSLGGLLDFRQNVLEVTRDQVGMVAAAVAIEFNAQHRLGLQFGDGAQGTPGADFFVEPTPRVLPRGNYPAPDVRFDPNNVDNIKVDGYRLAYDGANWTLTRMSDNAQYTLSEGDLDASGVNEWTVTDPSGASVTLADGVTNIAFASEGLIIDAGSFNPAAAAGDSYLIQPTRATAGEVGVALTRPSQIAAAGPLVAGEITTASGASVNDGNGEISGLSVSSETGWPLGGTVTSTATGRTLSGAISLTYAADADGLGNPGFIVAGAAPTTYLAYDPATESAGKTLTLPGYGDASFTVTGVPVEGDEFIIQNNSGGHGDNSNMLELNALSDLVSIGGTASFQEYYSSIVGRVGSTALKANVNRDAQEVMHEQAVAARDNVSGVNLEEEAANMMRYQQAYQAAAQVISSSRNLFDTLLAAVGR